MVLKMSKEISLDSKSIKDIQNYTQEVLSEIKNGTPPPHIAKMIFSRFNDSAKDKNPFRKIKQDNNRKALKLYRYFRSTVWNSYNPLFTACRMSCWSNLFDSINQHKFQFTDDGFPPFAERLPAINDFIELRRDIENASSVLYLGDNAGEIVFDKIFIEFMKHYYPELKIYFIVKENPLNDDVDKRDAEAVKMDEVARVISNGDSAPGTILEFCSEEFKKYFNKADLIISEGQGNYESLSDLKDKRIYYLLKVKCPVIARDIGEQVGSIIIKQGGN